MARLLYDTQTTSLQPYPRQDDEPVVGLDARYLVMALLQQPQPDHDPATERLEPSEVIDIDARTVTRSWAVVPIDPPAPPEPAANWERFVGFVADYPPLAAAMIAARDSLDPPGEPLTSGIAAALDEARLRGNYRLFRKAWLRIITAAAASGLELPAEALASIVHEAHACFLPGPFIAALQPSNAE